MQEIVETSEFPSKEGREFVEPAAADKTSVAAVEGRGAELARRLIRRGDVPLEAISDLTQTSLENLRALADQRLA